MRPPLPVAMEVAPTAEASATSISVDHEAHEIHDIRERVRGVILRGSPMLVFTESWLELFKVPTLRLCYPPMVWFVVNALSIALIVAVKGGRSQTSEALWMNGTDHDTAKVTLGTYFGFISFLYGFRTNNAYARWWEGRQVWGAIVNRTRSSASNACAYMRDHDRVHKLIINLILYTWATKEDIRFGKLKKDEMEGLLTEQEFVAHNKADHQPNLVLTAARRLVDEEVKEQVAAGTMRGGWDIVLNQDLVSFFDSTGKLERIAKTPMPFAYTILLRINLVVWILAYTMIYAPDFGYWGILQMAILSYLLL